MWTTFSKNVLSSQKKLDTRLKITENLKSFITHQENLQKLLSVGTKGMVVMCVYVEVITI